MDFSAMLPLLMGMMGNGGGDGGGNNMNMANIMSMLGGMNGGGGNGAPDMSMLMNMMNSLQNNKSRTEAEPPRRAPEEPRRREDDSDERPDRPPSYTPSEPEQGRRMVNNFFESNGIRNFEPLYFDENRKQFRTSPANGSRPIKKIAGDDLSRKIDGYFSGD